MPALDAGGERNTGGGKILNGPMRAPGGNQSCSMDPQSRILQPSSTTAFQTALAFAQRITSSWVPNQTFFRLRMPDQFVQNQMRER